MRHARAGARVPDSRPKDVWRLTAVGPAWMVPVFAVATIALGAWGWLSYGRRLDEALYRSIALFSIANQVYRDAPGNSDWRFLIGRWTGLMAEFGAALLAVGALLHQRGVFVLAQLLRQHVVVLGAGDLALNAFEAGQQARRRVLWVGAPHLSAGSFGALAIPGPADAQADALAAYAKDADHVLVAPDDDADGIVLARRVRAAAPDARITLLLRDASLAEAAAAMINEARTRVISPSVLAARALHLEHPPFLIAKDLGHRRIHALIVGFGQAGQAVARDIIVNCRTADLDLPNITVIDPAAAALEGVMRARAPELDACARFTFIQGAVGTDGVAPAVNVLLREIDDGGPITAAYVCRRQDTEGLGAAAVLQTVFRSTAHPNPRLFLRLRDLQSLADAGGQDRRGLNALTPFGDSASIIRASEFLSDEPDQAARAFSAAYRQLLPPQVREDPEVRSARPWDELDETFRQATRDAVAHIPAKMQSAGIDPALWLGLNGTPELPRTVRLAASDEDQERLARLEHERWNAQRRMEGWQLTRGPKDEARALHPNLRPYEDLSETVKAYDRALVLETESICWNAYDAGTNRRGS
ncbi:MAG: RyR domain-containing protein [Caulobacteraceae bacterium]